MTKEFEELCELLPAEVNWGDMLSPAIVAHIVDAAITKEREQKHRADVLAATIRELSEVVTHDAETKADFIVRVRNILSADPDSRVRPEG